MRESVKKLENSRPMILKRKGYLYATEFFAGMSVMAVELGASRLLAPYFSSSQIVWTIIIGTIMIAMALGNIYGGRSADKNSNPDKLYLRILIAAVWIAAIPLIGKYIILLIAGVMIVTISNNFLIIAAFLACMIIFVFPLFLLGTVTPSLAKYTVDSLDDSGKVVGTLGAYNTVGSIIGTFLPTFVTIPTVGTAITFFIFGGILLALSAIYFASSRRKARQTIIATILFLMSVIFGHSNSFAFWDDSLVYEGESVYNYLQVKADEDSIWLSTNVLFGVQSVMMKEDTLTGRYYDYAMAAPFMAGITEESGGNLLILGMGTGTYARQCNRYFSDLTSIGVEIDDRITDLSRTYFDLPDSITTINYDGRAYLQGTDATYDVIMVDAYQDITIPFQMSSVEFFNEVKSHLNENGVMVVNMNMKSGQPGEINNYLCDTIASVFSQVYLVDVPYSSNQIVFASSNPSMCENLSNNTNQIQQVDLKNMMLLVQSNLCEYQAGNLILTDDCAPVELLGMNVIDALIQEQVVYYREIYEKDGIEGILELQ